MPTKRGIRQMNYQFMGYTMINRPSKLFDSTPLLENGTETVTVAMAKDALDYMLGIIAKKSSISETYKTAKKVLQAMQMILKNQHSSRISKEDCKIAIDVLSEIQKEFATSEDQKDYIEEMALRCKLLIDGFGTN